MNSLGDVRVELWRMAANCDGRAVADPPRTRRKLDMNAIWDDPTSTENDDRVGVRGLGFNDDETGKGFGLEEKLLNPLILLSFFVFVVFFSIKQGLC